MLFPASARPYQHRGGAAHPGTGSSSKTPACVGRDSCRWLSPTAGEVSGFEAFLGWQLRMVRGAVTASDKSTRVQKVCFAGGSMAPTSWEFGLVRCSEPLRSPLPRRLGATFAGCLALGRAQRQEPRSWGVWWGLWRLRSSARPAGLLVYFCKTPRNSFGSELQKCHCPVREAVRAKKRFLKLPFVLVCIVILSLKGC